MLKKLKVMIICALISAPLMADNAYTNQTNQYTVAFPANWTQNSNVSGTDVMYLAPGDALSGSSNAYASVLSTKAPAGATLDSFFYQNLGALETKVNAFNETDSGALYIGGQDARFIVYNYQDSNGQEWSAIQFFLFSKQVAYLITCTALSDSFPRYLPTFKAIAQSFKFL